MSKILIASLIYWAACIVICWIWLIIGYAKAVKRGNQIHSKIVADFLITIFFAPFAAVFVIALWGIDLMDYVITKFEKK